MTKAVHAAWAASRRWRAAGNREMAELYLLIARDRARALARRRERARGWSVAGSAEGAKPAGPRFTPVVLAPAAATTGACEPAAVGE
jgi:hypothetical protein